MLRVEWTQNYERTKNNEKTNNTLAVIATAVEAVIATAKSVADNTF